MDIEGAEYEVIDSLQTSKITIDQILVEFHHMYKGIPIERTIDAIEKLKEIGFELFNISQRTYEFSFIRKTLISKERHSYDRTDFLTPLRAESFQDHNDNHPLVCLFLFSQNLLFF